MNGKVLAVVRVVCFYVDVAFDVRAVHISLESFTGRVGKCNLYAYVYCRVCVYLDCCESVVLEEEVRVVGCDLAVVVKVSLNGIYCVSVADNVVDNDLRVVGVNITVAVKVAVEFNCASCGNEYLSVYHIRCVNGERSCGGKEVCYAFILCKLLCEHVGGESVVLSFVSEVGDCEFSGVYALLLGVVAEFSLYLTVGSCAAEVILHHYI